MNWSVFFFVLLAGAMVWLLFYRIRHQKEAFSKENLTKSMGTLFWLALGLVAFVTLLVWIVRS